MSAVSASPAAEGSAPADPVRAVQRALYRAAKAHPGRFGPGGWCRMPAVNGVGKPCAGEPHARFDGRELETERRSGQGHEDKGHQGKPCGHQRLRDLPSIVVTAPAPDPTCVQQNRRLP